MDWEMEEKITRVLKGLIQCSKSPEFKEDCGDCTYLNFADYDVSSCIARLCRDAYTVITKMQQLLDLMEEIKRPEKLKRTIDALRRCVNGECTNECPMRDRDWIASGKATCRAFQDGDVEEIPTELILTAIELLEKLDGGIDGGDA
jgi:hypothetical protein